MISIFDPERMNGHDWPLPDRDTALESLQSATSGIELVAIFGKTSFDVLFVGEGLCGEFDSEEDLSAFLSDLSATEQERLATHELLSGAHPTGDGPHYETGQREGHTFVRVYSAGRGMLLAVDDDTPVEDVVGVGRGLLSL